MDQSITDFAVVSYALDINDLDRRLGKMYPVRLYGHVDLSLDHQEPGITFDDSLRLKGVPVLYQINAASPFRRAHTPDLSSRSSGARYLALLIIDNLPTYPSFIAFPSCSHHPPTLIAPRNVLEHVREVNPSIFRDFPI